MKILHLYLLLYIVGIHSSPTFHNSEFAKYNFKTLNDGDAICENPSFYIEKAIYQERIHSDKIILYHGESIGLWILQLIWKYYFYPESDDDWLPLRIEKLLKPIDKYHLLKKISIDKNDHDSKYVENGLSANPNLVSSDIYESAWSFACQAPFYDWYKVTGCAIDELDLISVFEKKYVPEAKRFLFRERYQFIMAFIQEKRQLPVAFNYEQMGQKFKALFPETYSEFSDYEAYFEKLSKVKQKDIGLLDEENHNIEGVLLQIIMEPEIADHLCYDSKEFGYLNQGQKLSDLPKQWNGQPIAPYSDAYLNYKNKEDYTQCRIALNYEFRQWPSSIKMNGITGLMEVESDYSLLKALLKEMVAFISERE